MNWTTIENQYWQLKAQYDTAWKKFNNEGTDETYVALSIAKSQFSIYCCDILEQLMEKNADVLKRLKEGE